MGSNGNNERFLARPVALKTENLTMSYAHGRGINNVSFSVPSGTVFGFLGPNGAGKTTTIRIFFDLLRPQSGRAEILGLDSVTGSMEIRKRTGYLPGDLALPHSMTGGEVLQWLSSLRPATPPIRQAELVERFKVQLDRPIKQLSKGNRQKLGLVQAFQHNPEVVVLDEPTFGLDPLLQDEFHRLVREYVAAGGTVFLSSHSLDEVQHTADLVGVIREGELFTVESVASLRHRGLRRITLTVASSDEQKCWDLLSRHEQVSELERHDGSFEFAYAGNYGPLLSALSTIEVVDLLSRAADLDEVFLDLYRGEK